MFSRGQKGSKRPNSGCLLGTASGVPSGPGGLQTFRENSAWRISLLLTLGIKIGVVRGETGVVR